MPPQFSEIYSNIPGRVAMMGGIGFIEGMFLSPTHFAGIGTSQLKARVGFTLLSGAIVGGMSAATGLVHANYIKAYSESLRDDSRVVNAISLNHASLFLGGFATSEIMRRTFQKLRSLNRQIPFTGVSVSNSLSSALSASRGAYSSEVVGWVNRYGFVTFPLMFVVNGVVADIIDASTD